MRCVLLWSRSCYPYHLSQKGAGRLSCQWMAEYQGQVRGLSPDLTSLEVEGIPCSRTMTLSAPGEARFATGAPGPSLLSSACPDTPRSWLNLLFISRYLVFSAEPIQAHSSGPKPLAHKLPSPSHEAKFSLHPKPAPSIHRSIPHRRINAFYGSLLSHNLFRSFLLQPSSC